MKRGRQEKISVVKSGVKPSLKLFIGTPTLGIIRAEWAIARWSTIVPCNWAVSGSHYGYSHTFPMGFLVADAQNVAVADCLKANAEWLLLLEDDVMVPPDIFLKLNSYMHRGKTPIVSGLYYTKGNPSEPLIYRGRGNSYFRNWKLGDKVWVDGVPTGCLLIHSSILKLMSDESEEYQTSNGRVVRKVFETPRKAWVDPETKVTHGAQGTSDLYWCDRVIDKRVLHRAGWKYIAKKKHPFLMDTSMFCRHIDLQSGIKYPMGK